MPTFVNIFDAIVNVDKVTSIDLDCNRSTDYTEIILRFDNGYQKIISTRMNLHDAQREVNDIFLRIKSH